MLWETFPLRHGRHKLVPLPCLTRSRALKSCCLSPPDLAPHNNAQCMYHTSPRSEVVPSTVTCKQQSQSPHLRHNKSLEGLSTSPEACTTTIAHRESHRRDFDSELIVAISSTRHPTVAATLLTTKGFNIIPTSGGQKDRFEDHSGFTICEQLVDDG